MKTREVTAAKFRNKVEKTGARPLSLASERIIRRENN